METEGLRRCRKKAQADLVTRPGCVLGPFDVTNAHNEFERADAIEAVQTMCPDMSPCVLPELTTPTEHLHTALSGNTLTLPKDRGGDQRDPIVSSVFLFDISADHHANGGCCSPLRPTSPCICIPRRRRSQYHSQRLRLRVDGIFGRDERILPSMRTALGKRSLLDAILT